MPPQLEEFGLIKTLRAIAKQINEAKNIKLELIADDDLPRWAGAIELGLYRICMELINNTLKHANANNIIIQLKQYGDQILCSYADDGKGLAENYILGHGFKNIEARLNSIGASSTMGNQPKGGFYASVTIPLPKPSK
jgi:signal transduction histidine kinase